MARKDDLLKPIEGPNYHVPTILDDVRTFIRSKYFWPSVGGLVLLILLSVLAGTDVLGAAGGVIVISIVALLYFLPAFLARNKPNASTVFVINLFFGWTFIGWVIALAMAVNNPTPQRPALRAQQQLPVAQPPAERTCPFCAEDIKAAAIVCKHCGREIPPLES